MLAAVLAASGLFLYLRLASHLALTLRRDLELRAQDVAALVRRPGASLAATSGGFVEAGESYAQLLGPDGAVVDATRPLRRTPLLDAAELAAARRGTVLLDRGPVPGLNEPSRLLAAPLALGGRRLVLVVGTTRQNAAETLAAFRAELLLAGPLALAVASGGGYLLAGVSLRQVESMRRRAAAISGEAPGARLPVPPAADEVARLATTLNAMLDRLELALERERTFVADAGHELRTPLALLRTELELAARLGGSPEELLDAVRRASQEVDRLSQLAEDLLLIARSDRGELPLRLERVRVDELFESVAARVEWRALAERSAVTAAAPAGAAVRGDRLRLEQALGNLVENALRYGGGSIRLEAVPAAAGLELHVRDDGPGFPAEFVGRAFERFSRADSARGRGGAGLGLAIVRTVALAHGGSAHAANRPGGGADVWLVLPAAER